MRALIGVSAVLVAGLNCAGRASERSDPGDPPWQAPAERGIQVAQADTAALPVARVAGVSGSAIGLGLTPPADGVRFAKFPDFPAELKLSHGFRLRGYWIVSVNDLPQLSLISPPGFSGAVKLTVQFFRDNETAAIAQRLMMVELKPAEAAARAEPPPGKPAAVATRAEAMSPLRISLMA
ncbi:hypothetical protein, partial [Rhodomicrobium vannielii]|uniref:hypothetical protein n=1 Tax=Rhodomicrobium vannielii TaxID=1069 RepID=UPI001AECED85